jgi:hypothetical protein
MALRRLEIRFLTPDDPPYISSLLDLELYRDVRKGSRTGLGVSHLSRAHPSRGFPASAPIALPDLEASPTQLGA